MGRERSVQSSRSFCFAVARPAIVREMVRKAELLVRPLHGNSFRFSLRKDVVSIGRSKRNDLVLADQWLERHHAEIRAEGDRFVLEDFRTKNGAYVNGERIDGTVQLKNNDIITLGDQQLTFFDAYKG